MMGDGIRCDMCVCTPPPGTDGPQRERPIHGEPGAIIAEQRYDIERLQSTVAAQRGMLSEAQRKVDGLVAEVEEWKQRSQRAWMREVERLREEARLAALREEAGDESPLVVAQDRWERQATLIEALRNERDLWKQRAQDR